MNTNSPDEGVNDNWREDATCALFSGKWDMWHAEDYSVNSAIAVGICFTCPVRQECLQEACDKKEPYGIWGGQPFSVRSRRGKAHNFLKLVGLPDPYDTMDRASPFHIQNLIEGGTDE